MREPIGLPLRCAVPHRILIVTNVGWFFLSHRLPLAVAARDRGYDVHVASGIEERSEETKIREHGFTFYRLSVTRGGTNLLKELRVIHELVSLYRSVRPALVHHVSLKAVLYGGIAARVAGLPRTLNSLTGMGYLFSARGWLPRLMVLIVRFGLRVALGGSLNRVIVQNSRDAESLMARGVVARERVDLIRGSGVDLRRFRAHALPQGTPLVLLVSRMLVDKGIREFLDAAEMLLARGVRARFALAGDIDKENPASLSRAELEGRQRSGDIQWLGHRDDVAELMRDSTIVCLPSYHEGLPKTLLEAAACGRPMVATDIAGCREVVVHGVTGLLVPCRDATCLADAIESLLTDRGLCERMGAAARAKAEAEFGIERIVEETLDVYSRLLSSD